MFFSSLFLSPTLIVFPTFSNACIAYTMLLLMLMLLFLYSLLFQQSLAFYTCIFNAPLSLHIYGLLFFFLSSIGVCCCCLPFVVSSHCKISLFTCIYITLGFSFFLQIFMIFRQLNDVEIFAEIRWGLEWKE